MSTKFSEWAEEQKAKDSPAQAELRHRFEEAFAESPGRIKASHIPSWLLARLRRMIRR